ncbi:MAG: nuclear transport factor 2 family protein, partial [Chitinophagaceae bacterium]|nr:nuclear transport factor 2 family protein [Chitinophagaceae bacterium]
MKLTKKLEAEILKAYHDLWDANLRGDIKTFASYLDNNVTVYGTAAGEIFTTKKEAAKFYKATADQMTGKAEFRKRKIAIKAIGNTVVVNELCDLYVLAKGAWMFYGHARITAIFEQKGNLWKVVHMHGSFPDSRTEEGEQIATGKIKKENLQLREAVKRRTVELEGKNKELQIESALERVRTVAMGMKRPADMLEVCKTISQQLKNLGVKEIRNVQTAVIYKEKGTYTNYEFYAKHNKLLTTEVSYTNHPMSKAFVKKMLNGPNEFFKKSLKGSKVQDWYAFQKKATNQFADTYLGKATSLNYYWYSLGPVALGISTYEPLSNEAQELFVRFRNVFELAYRRFLDIEKAEAQAREAQIELSLERVRAKAMAMHHSDELSDVLFILFEQFDVLGICPVHAHLSLVDLESNTYTFRMTGKAGRRVIAKQIINDDSWDLWKELRESFISNKPGHVQTLHFPGEAVVQIWKIFDEIISTIPEEFRPLPKDFPNGMFTTEGFCKFGAIGFQHYREATEEEKEIVRKFATEFGRLYQRFLDLQKAEEQAREAQIQLALERVRARTMAMQQSAELPDAAAILFQQIQSLGMPAWSAGYCIWNDDLPTGQAGKSAVTLWMSSEGVLQPPFTAPVTEDELFIQMRKGYEQGKALHVVEMGGDKLAKHYGYMRTLPVVGEILDSIIAAGHPLPTFQIMHQAYFSKGFLLFITYEPVPEAHDIFKRFAAVFEQTYTRFLDLQKAEAQAREAKIEAALEKVRSRSLAMHQSDELEQVVVSLFDRLTELGLSFDGALIFTFEKEKRTVRLWIATNHLSAPVKINLPYDEEIKNNAIIKDLWNAIENGKHIFNKSYSGETKNEYFRYVGKYNESKIPETVRQLQIEKESWTACFAAEKNSVVGFDSWSGHIMKEEDFQISIRFARVFEQAYTRFLDLQKAEAQAREAQIEAALERVRSRSMAMHKSDELLEVVTAIFEQLRKLGLQLWNCAIIRFQSTQSYRGEVWMSRPDGNMMPQSFFIPMEKVPVYKKLYDAWRNKEEFHVESLQEMEIVKHHNSIASLNIFPVDKMKQEAGRELPRQMFFHSINFSDGILGVITTEAVEDETLLLRFGNTFKQSYTRFLDLQKAEAQAREAQIQLAMERVRARTMAMQKSDELADLSLELVKQVQALGVTTWFCAFNIYDADPQGSLEWGSNGQGTFPRYRTPREGIFLSYFEAGQRGETLLINEIGENECPAHYDYLCTLPGVGEQLLKMKAAGIPFPASQIDHVAFFKYGYIIYITYTSVPEAYDIFKRFAKVFEQTYTRFLDLQKAEAQAREAQIEAALERVRSRTMGMQKSEELKEVIQIVYEQFVLLNINTEHTGFILDYKTRDDFHSWIADKFGTPSQVTIPYFDCIYYNRF